MERQDERPINSDENDDQQRTNNDQGDANGRDEQLYNDSKPNKCQENLPAIVEQQKDWVTTDDGNDDQWRASNELLSENENRCNKQLDSDCENDKHQEDLHTIVKQQS